MDDILIVEDDRALSQGIRLGLEGEGRRFIQASTLDQRGCSNFYLIS